MHLVRFVAVICAVLMFSPVAHAQSEAEFVTAFAGKWQALDPAASDGSGICTLTFETLSADGTYSASTADCRGVLSSLKRWSIQNGQLVLMTEESSILARLGGNQKRMTGEAVNSTHIVIERDGGDGSANLLQSALNASGCFYLGYTSNCAVAADEAKPEFTGGTANINVLVDLNARTEARADAPILGVVKQGTCLRVDRCVLSSDGAWCRAPFGQANGWVKKLSLRQNRWPVITFTNQC
jgi:hypothetical protein